MGNLLFFSLSFLVASVFTASAARLTFRTDPEYVIDTWETEDGLPENSATAMVQAPDSYLWFGTFAGVVRFDGIKFTLFDSRNTPELPSTGIVNLHGDKRRRIWFSTYGGVSVLEGRRWRSFSKTNGWNWDVVRTFAERPNGDLLFTTFDGAIVQFSEDRFTPLPSPPGERGKGYFAHIDESNRWWVVQHRFIGFWENGRWTQSISNLPGLGAESVACATARDGGMWLLLGNQLRKYRRGVQVELRELPEILGGAWSIYEDSQSNVWITGSGRGLRRVAPDGEMRVWTTTNGLSYHSTRFVFEDRERNIWVGTSGGGLQRFKPRRFRSYGVEEGLTERVVRSVSADAHGDVWIATYGQGLFRLTDDRVAAVPIPQLGGARVFAQSVLADSAGRVWLGTFSQGIWVLENGAFRRIPDAHAGGGNGLALFEDSKGHIWMSGGKGVTVYEGENVCPYSDGPEGFTEGVHCLAEDNKGVIWLGGSRGVARLEKDRFVPLKGGADDLRDVTFLTIDHDGTIWMNSTSRGLMRWRGGHLSRLKVDPGFTVHGIVEDAMGDFWMPTSRGVFRTRRHDLHAAFDAEATRLVGQQFGLSDGFGAFDIYTTNH